MADLLLQAMEARQSGDITQAKQLLAQALIQNPRSEGAWMMMADVVDDVKLKRNCLQRVLLINPNNEAANIAFMSLDISPLGPVVRGERYKPVVTPKLEKTPPFTPPFTWSGDDAQFQALGDMTYPDLTGDQVNQSPDAPTTFDWATESAEPDKTIEKIFDKVSNPDLAAQPLADTDLTWMKETPREDGDGKLLTDEEKEARLLDELVGATVVATPQPVPPDAADFTVSAEPQFGMSAFSATEELQSESLEGEPLLWYNPNARSDCLVILGIKSIIYANPIESDIPHIMGLFKEKKMMRDLLGENAGTIKLENIERLTFNPSSSELSIEYKLDEKIISHQLTFFTPQVRDEVQSAIELRLGAGFIHRSSTFSLKDKILFPVLCILLIIALGWFFIFGIPLLSQLSIFQSGIFQLILNSLQSWVNQIGTYTIFMIVVILVALSLIWLIVNLYKPTQLVIIERS
jgi:hypothetical protein